MQGSCLQFKVLTAGDSTFFPWRFGYLGNLFLAVYLLQWRAHLSLLLLCFETAVLQKSLWQEYFQSCIIVESRLCFRSQVFESDDEVMMVWGIVWLVSVYLLGEVGCCCGRERCCCWLVNPGRALKDKSLTCLEFAENFVLVCSSASSHQLVD